MHSREINVDFKWLKSDTDVNPVKPFLRRNLLQRASWCVQAGIMMSNKRRRLRINPCEGHLRRVSPLDGSFFSRGKR